MQIAPALLKRKTQQRKASMEFPLALYSDRHSIFKASKGEANKTGMRSSQFESMKELGVEMIHARIPQAKGRVERANGILQDRLIKKMRR